MLDTLATEHEIPISTLFEIESYYNKLEDK